MHLPQLLYEGGICNNNKKTFCPFKLKKIKKMCLIDDLH